MSRRPLVVASKPVRSYADVVKVESVKGPDYVELRLDYMKDLESIPPEVLALVKRPIIATLRDVAEGGVNPLSPEVKTAYLNRLHDLGIMYDVEVSFLKSHNVVYEEKIVSAHYLDRVPTAREVLSTVERYASSAFCVKIAVVTAPGYKSLLSQVLDLGYDNVAVMPIGSSPWERLAFGLLGSKLIYSYVDEPTAPGQMKYDKLLKVLEVLSIVKS
ncbi:MAG: type I 3-dehydroquinate dehydratase [Acidilobaceae archaeon]